jgi:hypothetical protein
VVRHVTSADKLSAGMWFTSVVHTNELLERLAGLRVAKGTLLAREFTLSKLLIARSGHQTGTCKSRGTLPTCGVYLRSNPDIFLLASGRPRFAPDEHLSSTQRDDWSHYMSLIKKSDVKNHLRTGASGKLLPFGSRSQPDATGYSNIGIRDIPVNTSSSGVSPDGQSSVVPMGSTKSAEAVAGSERLLEPSTIKASQA